MSTQYPGRIRINDVRLRFPKLIEPEQFQGEGELAFTAAFIVPPSHPQVAEIRSEMELVAKAKWPKDWQSIMKAGYAKDAHCLHDGDIKAALDGYEGNLYISGRNSGKDGKAPKLVPTLVMAYEGNPKASQLDYLKDPSAYKAFLQAAAAVFFDGCRVNASVEFWAQDNGYGKKVNCQIRGVQFFRTADAFAAGGGAPARSDDFDEVTEGADAGDFGSDLA